MRRIDVFRDIRRTLAQGGCPDAQRSSELILMHVLGVSREALWAHSDVTVSTIDLQAIQQCCQRRAQGEPMAYITGKQAFYKSVFQVTSDVLIPRPETEELVEAAIAVCNNRAPLSQPRVVDVGTGSGAIAISIKLECPGVEVWATDESNAALEVAQANAKRLRADVRMVRDDLISACPGPWDLIVANLPYIGELEYAHLDPSVRHFEPKGALLSKNRGMAHTMRLLEKSRRCLAPRGLILCEIGPTQADDLIDFAHQIGFDEASCQRDLSGKPRILRIGRFNAHGS